MLCILSSPRSNVERFAKSFLLSMSLAVLVILVYINNQRKENLLDDTCRSWIAHARQVFAYTLGTSGGSGMRGEIDFVGGGRISSHDDMSASELFVILWYIHNSSNKLLFELNV